MKRGIFKGLEILILLIFAISASCRKYEEGESLLKKGDYQAAVEYFQKQLDKNPKDPLLHNELGYALSHIGRYEDAIKHYQEAIRLKPDYPEAHYNMGYIFYQKYTYFKAIEEFSEAIKLDPNYAKAYNNRGLAYIMLRKFKEAKADFEKAIQLEPNNKLFKDNLEYCKKEEENYKKYIETSPLPEAPTPSLGSTAEPEKGPEREEQKNQ